MKDVKLVNKHGEFGSGNLDWSFKDGVVEYVEDQNAVAQAVMKATIATIDPTSGYGIYIKELRGQKDEVALRAVLATRYLITLSVIEKWYSTSFDVDLIDIIQSKEQLSVIVKMSIGEINVSVST